MSKEKIIRDILSSFEVPEHRSKAEIWNSIEAKINTNQKVRKPIFQLKKLIPLGIAASLALTFMFVWSGADSSFSSNLEYKIFELPDGSTAELGPHSTLKYSDQDGTRLLNLDGSAYFNVTKGKPFIVQSTNCEVKVLGTSFKIKDSKKGFDVKCYSGLVRVISDEHEVELSKGEGVNALNGQSVYSHNQNYDEAKNSLDYQNEYLSSILLDLELRKNLIIANKSANDPIVSYSIKNESSQHIGTTLAKITGLKLVQINENTFELH